MRIFRAKSWGKFIHISAQRSGKKTMARTGVPLRETGKLGNWETLRIFQAT